MSPEVPQPPPPPPPPSRQTRALLEVAVQGELRGVLLVVRLPVLVVLGAGAGGYHVAVDVVVVVVAV